MYRTYCLCPYSPFNKTKNGNVVYTGDQTFKTRISVHIHGLLAHAAHLREVTSLQYILAIYGNLNSACNDSY